MIRALLVLALLGFGLAAAFFGCGHAPAVNTDNTTARQLWCFAGTAPADALSCAATKEQCERDKAAADQDADWLSVSACKPATVAVRLGGESGG